MKRILYIVYSLNIGGLERMVVDMANALAGSAYEPYICCIAQAGDLALEFAYPKNLSVIGNTGRINPESWIAVRRVMQRFKIDLVHSHNPSGLLYGFLPAKLLRIPVVHTNHGLLAEEEPNWVLRLFERYMSRNVERYICVSEALRGTMIERYGIKEDKTGVIQNGVAVPETLPMHGARLNDDIVIGTVGRLSHIKNQQLLIELFPALVAEFPRCRLELIGDGDARERLEELVERLSISDRVRFRGRVLDAKERMASFDIFVLPSRSEGLPMALLEAMSLGTICIASRVGGIPAIIEDGTNGFLFESGNGSELREKLQLVLGAMDSDGIDAVRREARRTIEHQYSLRAMVEAHSGIYGDLIGMG